MKTQLTETHIIPVKPKNGLVAFASCVLNQDIYLSSIAVHKKLNGLGYRLTYPTKKVGNSDLNIYHPINKELSKAIEEAVFKQIEKLNL